MCEEVGNFSVCRGKGSNVFILKDVVVDPSIPVKASKVLITHGHVDHFLYAKDLVGRAEIYAPKLCLPFIRYPEMNYVLTVGYVNPPPQFKESGVEAKEFEGPNFIHVPGHTYGHYAYLFETSVGRVLVAGDTLYGDDYLKSNKLLYHLNTSLWLESMRKLEGVDVDLIVPGHGSLGGKELIMKNVSKVLDMINYVNKFVNKEARTDVDIFIEIVEDLGLDSDKAYPVFLPTIRAILGYLKSVGKIKLTYEKGVPRWSTY